MKKIVIFASILTLFVSCANLGYLEDSSLQTAIPRVIILDGVEISEDEAGGFYYWDCKDYIENSDTLLEVGYFGDPELDGLGFILFDGTNVGSFTLYSREGVNRRWDWNENYSIIIKPDNTGLYYDFTGVEIGESTKAEDVYKCYPKSSR